MTQLYYNRLRLTAPLKRVGGEKGSPDSKFEPCSWDEALGTIAKNVLTDDRYFDNLSGQQAYKCFACPVRKA